MNRFMYPQYIPAPTWQIQEGEEEKPDYGDELTEEQKVAATPVDDQMTDEEVQAALDALKEGDITDDTKAAKDKLGEDDDAGTKTEGIPKKRFDAAVKKERDRAIAAEKELQRYKRESKTAPATPAEPQVNPIEEATAAVSLARKSWQKALLDNDEAKADAALDAMTQAETYLDEMRINTANRQTRQQAAEDVSYFGTLETLEKDFPQIDEGHEDYDAELMQKITRLHTGLIRGGMDMTSALKEAASVYLTPVKEIDPKNIKDTLRDKAKKTLSETLKNQPPDDTGVGHTDTKGVKLQPSRMSRKQWDGLSEDQRSVLRGDNV